MTRDELDDYVWRRLPMRKYMAGRRVVDDLVALAVENWEGEYLGHATSEEGREVVAMSIAARVKRGHQLLSGRETQEYGMIWMLLLGALVNAVVQILVKWWMERQSHRVMLAGWQREATR